jgi:hypothetical protein
VEGKHVHLSHYSYFALIKISVWVTRSAELSRKKIRKAGRGIEELHTESWNGGLKSSIPKAGMED